jgi:hypothetical protein
MLHQIGQGHDTLDFRRGISIRCHYRLASRWPRSRGAAEPLRELMSKLPFTRITEKIIPHAPICQSRVSNVSAIFIDSHGNSTWPKSREVVARDLSDLPAKLRAKLVRQNVAKVYNIPIPTPVQ